MDEHSVPKSHDSVYPWTPPPWLPDEILKAMVAEFIVVMKLVLEKLVAGSPCRKRTHSTRSADSYSSDHESVNGVPLWGDDGDDSDGGNDGNDVGIDSDGVMAVIM